MKQREGMPVRDGVFRVVQGMRLAPPEDKKHQRWSAQLQPLKL